VSEEVSDALSSLGMEDVLWWGLRGGGKKLWMGRIHFGIFQVKVENGIDES